MAGHRRLPGIRARSSGFTLIELVLVMAILVVVLTATYRLIIDCLDAERTIDRLTIPEKVGEGILTLFRSDLSGTIWRQLGTRVFFVIDNGAQRDARDVIKFLSTVEPSPREEVTQGTTVEVSELRSITGICYFLKQNQGIDGVPTMTLYRKEIVDFTPENPLDAPGQNYEVFDKVAYLSIECYDSYNALWLPTWDSEARIRDEQLDLEAAQLRSEGIAMVPNRPDTKTPDTKRRATGRPDSKNPLTNNAPGFDPGIGAGESEMLPPAAVPTAVRVEVGIYAGQGNKIERDTLGTPIIKTYATIVPILTAQRVRIQTDEETGLDGEDVATGIPMGGKPGGGNEPPPHGGKGGRPGLPPAKAGAPGGRVPVPGGPRKAR